jgi:hypothetical protein
MSERHDPHIDQKLLGSLFARFTADRDALLAAVERCEQRLVDLTERLSSFAPEAAGDAAEAKAEQALAIAKEALAAASEALGAVRQHRG